MRVLGKWRFVRGRYAALLTTLLIAFGIQPLLQTDFGKYLLEVVLVAALLSGLRAMNLRRSVLRLEVALLVFVLVLSFLAIVSHQPPIVLAATAARILFLVLVVFSILADIFRSRVVTGDTLAGAVCVYLLISLIWGLSYMLLEFLVPESFSFTQGKARLDLWLNKEFYGFFYFSLVTITTVGYGDMAPVSTAARSLATIEALLGQLYLTILVARLVGMHLAGQRRDQN